MSLDLQPAADELARIAAGLTDDQLDRPTPCQIPVRQLLAHVLGLCVAFRDAAVKLDGPTTRTAPELATVELPGTWRQELPDRLDALAEAWRDPAAWSGLTMAGGIQLPGEVMGVVANNELVVHGWDLARATDSDFDVAPENLAASWQLVSQTPDDPAARQGMFGPRVPVPEDAPLLDRVLGGAGRDPHWTSGS